MIHYSSGMNIQFILTLVMGGATLAGASLVWPKLTDKPRPKPLDEIRKVVLKTPMGQQAATVLGVTNEETVEPINIASVAADVTNTVSTSVTNKAQEIVTRQAVEQLTRQIDQLPSEQKAQLQQIFCKPR